MRFEPTSPRSELKKDMDRLIAQYKMEELPRLSGANILQRVEDWFNSIVLKINRERGRTKVTT